MAQPIVNASSGNVWEDPFTVSETFLPWILLALLVEALLYGAHVILFFMCVRILVRRRRRMQYMMLAAIMVIFILATADVAVSWKLALRHSQWLYNSNSNTIYRAIYPKFIIHLVNNVIADVLLIMRCYIVWGRRKIILFTTGSLLIAGTVFGIFSEGTTAAEPKKFIGYYMFLVLVLNVVVTILTAGRIFWIARRVRLVMGAKMVSHYHFAIGVLVESGVIYSASTILVFSLVSTKLILMAAALLIRVVCIMPILIIVQIALGQTIEDVQATVSRFQVTGHEQVVLDTIISSGQVDSERGLPTHDEPKPEDDERFSRWRPSITEVQYRGQISP